MGDSIKFGPEWLRNMSNDSGGLSSAATSSTGGGGGTNNFAYPNNQTRYPLADYRYGREEMLSLYDKNFKLPELLPKFNKLYIEKMQTPLALLPPTADDDTPRGLTPIGGISSERSGSGLNANSSSGSALGISNAIGSIGMSARGMRGSSIDRGRGRARGGLYHSSLGSYQSRSGFVYDEDARGAGPRAERSWTERNGSTTTEAEWSAANSSSSPRKDFSQLRSGPDGSWRRNRGDEDGQIPNGTNEGWRTSSSINTNSSYKWPVRSTSWRGGDGDANSSFNSDGGPPRLERSKSTQGGSREMDGTGGPGMRRFGMNANASWDEDNYPEWAMDEPIEGGGSFDATGAFLGNVDKQTGEKLKYQSGDGLQSDKNQSQSTTCDDKSESITSNGGNDNDNSMTDISENNNSIEDEAKPNDESLIESSSQKEIKTGRDNNKLSSNMYETDKERKPNEDETIRTIPDSNYIDSAIIAINKQKSLTTDRMLEVAEDIEKLIMDDDQSCAESDDQLLPECVKHAPKHSTNDDAMATADKSKEKDMSDLWYYRDPQGKVQGPFTATEMLEWYRAGYFDETLNVRRVCDPQFLELGELLKACSGPGAIPFVSMPIIPLLLQSNAKADISLSANAKVHPASPTKPLANLVHNQKILASQPTPSTNTSGYYDMLQSQSFMNLMNAPPNDFLLSNTLPKHPSQNIPNLPNALSKQAHLKNQQQTQSLQHLLSQHKKDFNAPDGATANNVPIIHQDPVIRMLNSMNLPHQPNPANVLPVQTMPQPTTPQNNSFQSLMMQLHTMQKPHVLQQQIQQHHQQSIIMNAMNLSTLPRNHNTLVARNPIDEIAQQQQPQMPHQPDVRAAHGLWDLPIPPQMQPNANAKLPAMHSNIVPSSSMKTELQIIEHLHAKVKQQDVSRLQFPQFAGINNQAPMNHHHPHNEIQSQHLTSQQQAQQQQQSHQSQQHLQQPSQVIPSAMVLGNIPNDLLLQQSDMFRTKNDNIKDIQLDANKQLQAGVGKVAKNKMEPVTVAATLKTIDAKTIQANNNSKINNILIEPTTDEQLLQSDKIDINNKLNKAKNVNAAAASAAAMETIKPIEIKSQSKAVNDDAMMKKSTNNNANANTTAPKTTTKESTKKKKEQKAAEEKRRQQEEEERQQLEERKRLELIAAQRKAKLVDQNSARTEPTAKRNNLAASVAPWSNITENASSNASNTPLTLTEIQKSERERRAESYRMEQAQQQNQALLDQQQHKESVLKWKLNPQNQAKSLAEIQAEESKARQQTTLLIAANQAQQNKQNAKKDEKWPVSTWSMIWGNDQAGNNNPTTNPNAVLQSGNGNANCFWEDPSKSTVVQSKMIAQQNGTPNKPLARSQTVSSMQSISNESKAKQAAPLTTSGSAVAVNSTNLMKSNAAAAATVAANSNNKKVKDTTVKPKKKATNSEETTNDEFGSWCNNKLAAHVNVIDVPTFVSFLRDIESPFEVKDYIRMYLGETKECSEFAKNFLERRSKYKNQQRAANAHIDDMCSPAPAITPANESQESKGKGKKEKKKNKMTKLDSRILGFSVTSAEDRLNVGARDYARDGP